MSNVARAVCETFRMQREGNSTTAAEESRPGLAAVAWRDNPDSKPGLTEQSLPQGFPLWPYCQQLCQRGAKKRKEEEKDRTERELQTQSSEDDRYAA